MNNKTNASVQKKKEYFTENVWSGITDVVLGLRQIFFLNTDKSKNLSNDIERAISEIRKMFNIKKKIWINTKEGRKGNELLVVCNGDDISKRAAKEISDRIFDAFHGEDERTIGLLLGYPKCCVENFINKGSKRALDDYIQDCMKDGLIWVSENGIETFTGLSRPKRISSISESFTIPYTPCKIYCNHTLTELGLSLNTLKQHIINALVKKVILL